MAFDRIYLITALVYAAAGMLLGTVMAATRDHIQHVTHAHILLVGFVVSFIYAVIYRLWLNNTGGALAKAQFALHQAGALAMVVALYLLYGNVVELEKLEPVLAAASISVMAGILLMLVLLFRSGTGTHARASAG